jgi:hypothetical protein
MPVYDSIAYDLAPINTPDLDLLVRAIAVMWEQVEFYSLDRDDDRGELVGYGIALDVKNPDIPREALDWAAQFVGEIIPIIAPDADAVQQILDHPYGKRGTPKSIVDAAKATLTGDRDVVLRERDPAALIANGFPSTPEDDAYGLTVITYTSQTPDPAATEAAIRKVLPGGIILGFHVLDGQDWQLVKDNNANWAAVKSKYPTWQHVRTDEAT